jgi:two-component system phosphate regulon sensor histidine kinase PhoR
MRPTFALAGLTAAVAAWIVAGPVAALAAGVVAAATALAVAAVVDRGLTQGLGDVAAMLGRWAAGDFRDRLRWARADALGRLADAVNDTARALAERQTQEGVVRARLEAMLAALDVGVVYVTDSRRVLAMNAAAEILFDTHEAEAVGRALLEVVPDLELDRLAEECLENGTTASAEFDPGPGEQRVMRYRLAPIRGEDGRTTGLLIVVSDLTHERRLERVRQDFIENVTHELQTPLTSIRGFAETLAGEAGADAERRRRYLGIVEREAERLSRLVADLLELSRWEGKRPPLNARRFDLRDLVAEVVAVYRPLIEGAGLAFKVELPEGALPIVADREAAARVLRNLLDNAKKYTRQGAITLRVFRVGRWYRLEVEDTGMGLTASAIPRVFERFYRVDKGRDRESGGTGLGLAIVRHLVEAHGGSVRAQSDGLGLGSRFTVEWPSQPRQRAAVPKGLAQEDDAGEGEEDAAEELGALADPRADLAAEDETGDGEPEPGHRDGGDGQGGRGGEDGQREADRERV